MAQTKTKTKTKSSGKPRSFTAFALMFAALALAIAVVINLLASRLDVVWDMTPTSMYKLTDTSRNYLEKLDKQVNFYFLLDMDVLSTDTNSMALYHALDEYRKCDSINFVSFEPDEDPELTAKLQELGYSLSRGDIVIECEGRSKHIPARNMYQSYIDTADDGTQSIDSMYFSGENYITGAIDSVVSGREAVIYFLTGHGEKSLSSDYTTLVKNLSNRNYLAKTLDLTTADAVPADASMIILAAPQLDISKDELRMLDDYLDQGGNICFWMSPNEAELKYNNIDTILREFGLALEYDIVAETNKDLHVSGDPHTFRCSVVAPAEDSEIDLTSGVADFINNGIVPFMSDTRSFCYAASTSSDSSVVNGSLLQTTAVNGVCTAVGEVCGGTDVLAEDLTSEELPFDLAMYGTSTLRNNAKIMVMGNAEFIDDSNVAQDYMIVPVNLMLSVFSWMYDSDLMLDMGIADKERTYDSLLLNSEAAANTTNIVFIVVPLCVGLVGACVWLKRRYS